MMLHGKERTTEHSIYKHDKDHMGERDTESLWNSVLDILYKPRMTIKDAFIVLGFLLATGIMES